MHLKLLLLMAAFIFSGCAGMNGPCGPFGVKGSIDIQKNQYSSGACTISYTLTNESERIFRPVIWTRFLDNQGNTLGEDNVHFGSIDQGKKQTKEGGVVNCRFSSMEVIRSDYISDEQSICGVTGKVFSQK